MPGATARGMLAKKHIMKHPIALEMQVAATRDCFTARCSRSREWQRYRGGEKRKSQQDTATSTTGQPETPPLAAAENNKSLPLLITLQARKPGSSSNTQPGEPAVGPCTPQEKSHQQQKQKQLRNVSAC